jgi:hypothetical protein
MSLFFIFVFIANSWHNKFGRAKKSDVTLVPAIFEPKIFSAIHSLHSYLLFIVEVLGSIILVL